MYWVMFVVMARSGIVRCDAEECADGLANNVPGRVREVQRRENDYGIQPDGEWQVVGGDGVQQ